MVYALRSADRIDVDPNTYVSVLSYTNTEAAAWRKVLAWSFGAYHTVIPYSLRMRVHFENYSIFVNFNTEIQYFVLFLFVVIYSFLFRFLYLRYS